MNISKRVRGILTMPVAYFGLILSTAVLVAAEIIPEIPSWLLPVYAILSVIAAKLVGRVYLLDVAVVYLLTISVFPLGVLYLMGIAGNLGTSQTASLIASDLRPSDWLWIGAPLVAAVLTHLAVGWLRD